MLAIAALAEVALADAPLLQQGPSPPSIEAPQIQLQGEFGWNIGLTVVLNVPQS
jgi:hypothetical protein